MASPGPHEARNRRTRRRLLMALIGAGLPAAAASPAITRIVLERSCFGCGGPSTLVLERDGRARLTTHGQARAGTADETVAGRVGRREFEHLARLALAEGFFAWQEVYEDPSIADGSWTTIAITRGGQEKRVTRREEMGPEGHRRLEAAIVALQSRTSFVPAPSR